VVLRSVAPGCLGVGYGGRVMSWQCSWRQG
jgi:hypothetical protein